MPRRSTKLPPRQLPPGKLPNDTDDDTDPYILIETNGKIHMRNFPLELFEAFVYES